MSNIELRHEVLEPNTSRDSDGREKQRQEHEIHGTPARRFLLLVFICAPLQHPLMNTVQTNTILHLRVHLYHLVVLAREMIHSHLLLQLIETADVAYTTRAGTANRKPEKLASLVQRRGGADTGAARSDGADTVVTA